MSVTVAIAVIGDEVLSGHIEDTNTRFLAKKLFDLGAELKLVVTLPDELETIIGCVNDLKGRFDFVITTGGIGPTPDDKTREAISRVFGAPLELHPTAEEVIRSYYGERTTEERLALGYVPRGAEVLLTPGTRIPFFSMENVFVLPGIPILVQSMFPVIAEKFRGEPIHTAEFTTRKGESQFARIMTEAEKLFPEVSIGSYPRIDKIPFTVRLLFKSRSKEEVERAAGWLKERIEGLPD